VSQDASSLAHRSMPLMEAAKASAAKTGGRYAVFVTEATRCTRVGLEPIQARRSA
jgi:hypothetical protein